MRDLFELLAEIEAEDETERKLTLPILRKKYKGKKVDINKLPDGECFFMEATMELDWEFSYFRDWSGEDTMYNVTIQLNQDMSIKKIGAMQCRRYTGSDATSDGYKNKRAEDFDYWLLEERIKKILKDEM